MVPAISIGLASSSFSSFQFSDRLPLQLRTSSDPLLVGTPAVDMEKETEPIGPIGPIEFILPPFLEEEDDVGPLPNIAFMACEFLDCDDPLLLDRPPNIPLIAC